jgi:amidase
MATASSFTYDAAMLTRRGFIGATLATGAWLAIRPARADAFELEEATIADLAAGMAAGRFTARRLAELYLGRIAALDKDLRSVLYTNPDALAAADALDAERKSGKVRGPLHGVPILVKGNIDTGDALATTAGSLALAGRRAARDAFVVERLRAAGCVILGKTNLSEWANIRSSHSSSGWSGEGGQCRNPYALDRSPSGSSSGSAAAAAASFCAAAVGTETDGSILSPSSCQALVGIKPTIGLCSRSGIIPIAHSQDTPGPMARTVADAAALLLAMAGFDTRDPATAASRGAWTPPDLATLLDKGALKGARLGVARKRFFGHDPAPDAAAAAALQIAKDAGAVLVDPVDIGDNVGDAELDVLLYELKADLATYLADAGAPVKDLADVIAFNEAHAKEEMPFFAQELFVAAQKKGPLTDAAYRKAKDKCRAAARGLDSAFAKHKLDAVIAPTGGPAWLIDHVNGDAFTGSSTEPTAVAGYPAITVPAAFHRGLPIGVSLMGRPFSEPKLIRLAFALEQASRVRARPTFRPTADV